MTHYNMIYLYQVIIVNVLLKEVVTKKSLLLLLFASLVAVFFVSCATSGAEEPEEPKGSNFVLTETSSLSVCDGVTYTESRYIDGDSNPLVTYLLRVEKGSMKVINQTPSGRYNTHGLRTTTEEAAHQVQDAGFNVVGAINADGYSYNNLSASPSGTCIKDSIVIKMTNGPFFAVLDDGSYLCAEGPQDEETMAHVKEAVGASEILVRNGVITASSSDHTAPRTAIGYDEDGTLYLLVIDGRQEGFSHGATLIDTGILMKKAGATEAINLDGGGSSTMVIKENNDLVVKNSPSDGTIRSNFNSLVLVL